MFALENLNVFDYWWYQVSPWDYIISKYVIYILILFLIWKLNFKKCSKDQIKILGLVLYILTDIKFSENTSTAL